MAIQGTVVRVGNIKPLVTHIAFQCLLCQGVQVSVCTVCSVAVVVVSTNDIVT